MAGIDTLVQSLLGAGVPGEQTAQPAGGGINAEVLAALAGQLAQVIAPGSIGAGMGALGTQQTQQNILAREEEGQNEALLKALQELTGKGATTTGVTIGPDGQLKITGTAAPGEESAVAPTPATPATPTPKLPTGGGETTAPFHAARDLSDLLAR